MAALPFPNRAAAGEELAGAVAAVGLEHPLVLAVPRGGVEVAVPVARATDGTLDLVVVRKVPAPHNAELGLGAVGAEGEAVIDSALVEALRVGDDYLAREIARQRMEVRRRLETYRGDRPLPEVAGRDVVVVDDGIATGGTVAAAGRMLRTSGPRRLVLAVPVAPRESVERVRDAFDEVVCLYNPEPFFAVGQWYSDFRQVTDEEVREVLAGASQ